MPAFFPHNRGSVVRVTSQGGELPFRIVLQDTTIGDPLTRAIITQAAIVEQGSYQFLHTLNETIYAYVFGDRIGELRISGICFALPCGELLGGGSDGAKQVSDTYRQFRIAQAGKPVGINFGAINYDGFLVGMSLEIVDAERNLGQWAFRFNTFPGHQQ